MDEVGSGEQGGGPSTATSSCDSIRKPVRHIYALNVKENNEHGLGLASSSCPHPCLFRCMEGRFVSGSYCSGKLGFCIAYHI